MASTEDANREGLQARDRSASDPAAQDPRAKRSIIEPQYDENGRIVITVEMRELAEAVAHPKGDPYLNGRDLGFYCEQCG